MVVTLLLSPVIFVRHGHRLHNVLVVVVLWVYVVMAGASASLVRAALMFSFLQLAQASSRRYNSLNSLSAALFAMLIYRPNYLYDISFQLSVMAVMGIVVWGVPLIRRVAHGGFVMRSLLTTLIIGATATLWTMPIVSHTFGNIPYLGVIITPVAMLTAYVVVGCGIFALILPHPLSMPFGWVMEHAAWVQNSFVERVASERWVTINYSLSEGGVATIYAIFLLITLVIWSICEKKW
jgi:competence protein ComEC